MIWCRDQASAVLLLAYLTQTNTLLTDTRFKMDILLFQYYVRLAEAMLTDSWLPTLFISAVP